MVTFRRNARERNRAGTEGRILEATGRLLARRGFASFGINAVAREARVDKVLIYRYWGGLDGLMAAYGRTSNFWPPTEETLPSAESDSGERAVAGLKALLRGVRARPLTQEILRWELVEHNALTDHLADVREQRGLEALARLGVLEKGRGDVDVAAVAALLTAGIIHLVLRAKTAPAWLGVPLRGTDGWARIEGAIEAIVKGMLNAAPKSTRRRKS